MDKLVPGASVVFTDPKEKGARDWLNRRRYLVTGIEPPAKGKESMLARWKVLMLAPGDEKPRAFSLQAVMGSLILGEGIGTTQEGQQGLRAFSSTIMDGDIFDGLSTTRVESLFGQDLAEQRLNSARRDFFWRRSGTVTRNALVLDGNMYLASEWAAATKNGQGIIYSDERGIRHRAVLMKEDAIGHDMLQHMPVRLWAPAMIRELVRQASSGGGAEGQVQFDASELIFATSIQGALNRYSSEGTQFLVLPGKGVALSVSKKELSRITRALRASLKAELRLAHPEFKTYTPERKKEIEDAMLSVKTSTKKGRRPVIFIECDSFEQSDKAVDLVCRASGIEIYVPRGTRMGDRADAIQRAYFEQRREAAQAVLDRARTGGAQEQAVQGAERPLAESTAEARETDPEAPEAPGDASQEHSSHRVRQIA